MDRKNYMEKLDVLEERIDHLLGRVKTLEAENKELQSALESERASKAMVGSRIDDLLKKIQGEIS